jgi:hypothetical protein
VTTRRGKDERFVAQAVEPFYHAPDQSRKARDTAAPDADGHLAAVGGVVERERFDGVARAVGDVVDGDGVRLPDLFDQAELRELVLPAGVEDGFFRHRQVASRVHTPTERSGR